MTEKQYIFKQILLKSVSFLDSNNINYKIVFGTLLGLYRDKNFIEHDSDIDIAIFDKGKFLDECYLLLKDGFSLKRDNKGIMSFDYKGLYIDFYFFTYNEKYEKYYCYDYILTHEDIKDEIISIEGIGEFKTVGNVENYLIRHYGESWNTPIKGFTALSSYNLQKSHWLKYYDTNKRDYESSFARYVSKMIKLSDSVLDVGCGDGTDTIYLSNFCKKIIGIDGYSKFEKENILNASFEKVDFYKFGIENDIVFDVIYCRWVLHAITESTQDSLIQNLSSKIKSGGLFLIECRGIDSEINGIGLKISETEYINDHYRRFIDPVKLISLMKILGFLLISFESSNEFSTNGLDKPILNRYKFIKL